MEFSDWPTRADIELHIIELGFASLTIDDATGAETKVCMVGPAILRDSLIDQAVSMLDAEAGWKLFADSVTPTVVYHDPPAPQGAATKLRLKQPAHSIDSIRIGAIHGDDASGTPRVLYQDVWPRGPDEDTATVLEFRVPVVGLPLSVAVRAVWGRFKMLPGDLYSACVQVASGLAITEFREGLKANPVRWQEGDVSESYGEIMLKSAGDGLVESGLKVARRYANMGAFL